MKQYNVKYTYICIAEKGLVIRGLSKIIRHLDVGCMRKFFLILG